MLFTPLHRLELRTTVRQCAYGGLIKPADARRILRYVGEDLDDGTLVHEATDWTGSLRQAEDLGEKLAWTNPCRSLDLWHVAVAVEIKAEIFVTFDKDQLALAKAHGLKVLMPR